MNTLEDTLKTEVPILESYSCMKRFTTSHEMTGNYVLITDFSYSHKFKRTDSFIPFYSAAAYDAVDRQLLAAPPLWLFPTNATGVAAKQHTATSREPYVALIHHWLTRRRRVDTQYAWSLPIRRQQVR